MFSDSKVQAFAKANFVPVLHYYDGLNGKVIKWTLGHGNSNHDPSILAWVLDPGGKQLGKAGGSKNSPSSFISWMKKMGKGSFPLVDAKDYKELKSEARTIAGRGKLGSVLVKLRKYAEGGEGVSSAKQAEAKTLLSKVLGYASWKQNRASQLKGTDPAECLKIYKELSVQFKGDEIGASAKTNYDSLRKDKAFNNEIKASQYLAKVDAIAEKFKSGNRRSPLQVGSDAWKKKNRLLLNQATPILALIVKKYPATKAASKANALISKWKLK